MLSRLFSTVFPSSFSLAFRSFGACPAVHRWADHNTPLSYEAAQAEANRCLLCHDAPCNKACPAGTKPAEFIRSLYFENPAGGAQIIADNNAFGGVCGTVCPVSSLCEGACSRKQMDNPVQIRNIQRYLHDYGMAEGVTVPPSLLQLPSVGGVKRRVGIIGAGPAGLTAARELTRAGVEVVVHEKFPKGGGILRYAISQTRITHDLVDQEIKRITDLGVEVRYNDLVSGDLRAFCRLHHYDALFYSPGLPRGLLVPTPGDDAQGVCSAMEFLESANTGTSLASECIGRDLVVIGAGSVAMDVATAALSLGCRSAYAVFLPSMTMMTADVEEIEVARKSGVIFRPCTRMTAIQQVDNKVSSISVTEVEASSGPRDPYIDRAGSQGIIRCAMVVFAVRQTLTSEAIDTIKKTGMERNAAGWVIVDEQTSTPVSNIYSGGDVTSGGSLIVHAVCDMYSGVRDGKKMAESWLLKHGAKTQLKDGLKGEKSRQRYPSMLDTQECLCNLSLIWK